jgi:hypothetical protein
MPEPRPGAGSGKVIGRILSLGFPLPGVNVDNYTFLSAPSFFDYDALVVDPAALSALIEGVLDDSVEATTFGGARVRNNPETVADVALGDLLLRRHGETRALLQRGGVVVCFAHPCVMHTGVVGADPLDNYYWLPAPEGVAFIPPALQPGDGSRAHVVDYHHPLAAFVDGQLANVGYRAYFDPHLLPGARVFVRSHGGAVIGVDVPLDGGRVIFVPALASVDAGDARYAMSEALQAGVRRALGVMAEGRPPSWMGAYALPGLDERNATLADARRDLDAAQAAFDEAERSHEELVRYQRLLWQDGAVGLDDVVIDALRLIGFEVYANDRASLELRCNESGALFEIEASEDRVDMAAHHRLRQRIERAIERGGVAPRGVLFVNGLRLQDPATRGAGVTEPLRVAASAMRYCVAPTATLYDAAAAKLRGDDAAVVTYRARLIETDGVLGD